MAKATKDTGAMMREVAAEATAGEGLCDLHCHLLYGLDDGAKTLEDSLAMARLMVELGFGAVAPSPHNRSEYASREEAEARLVEVREALRREGIALGLETNSENDFLDEGLLPAVAAGMARGIGLGAYLLVEAPFTAPLPVVHELVFRLRLKGVRPLIAHPERCVEFQREGRAAEVVAAGALLQLNLGSLVGRHGATAQRLARTFLEEGLYAVAATDLHSPVGAREWLGRALDELRRRAGEEGFRRLMRDQPLRIFRGESLES